MYARSSDAPVHGAIQGPVRIVAAAVRGVGHAREGVPCQDAWAFALDDDWVFAALCDGAGSALAGGAGARVGSAILVKALRRAKRRCIPSTPEAQAHWRNAIRDGIERARHLLGRLAEGRDYADVSPFHATLLGVVASPQGGCFFHIGDGAGVAAWPQPTAGPSIVSPPANGRYLDETYFFTQASWQTNLRLTPFGPSPLILLMSDGPSSFVLNERQDGVDPGFCAPLIEHLDRRTPAVGAGDLAETLDAPDAQRLCDDDKSLIVVRITIHG